MHFYHLQARLDKKLVRCLSLIPSVLYSNGMIEKKSSSLLICDSTENDPIIHQNMHCLWDIGFFLPRARKGMALLRQGTALASRKAWAALQVKWKVPLPLQCFAKHSGASGWINRLTILATAACRAAKQKWDIWSHRMKQRMKKVHCF